MFMLISQFKLIKIKNGNIDPNKEHGHVMTSICILNYVKTPFVSQNNR